MQVSMKAGDLAEELALAQRVVARKETIPALQHVMVEMADQEHARVSATDQDITSRAVIEARSGGLSDMGKRMLLPAARLFEIAKLIPAEAEILLSQRKDWSVDLTADSYKVRLLAVNPDDYPILAEMTGDVATLSGPALASMVQQTRYAISDREDRFFMAGACLVVENGVMRMSATDSYRLASSEAKCETTAIVSVLLPTKLLGELVSLLDGAESVQFSQTENHVFFKSGNRELSSRKIDGKAPPYDRLIPQGNILHVVVDRDRLTLAAKRAAAVAAMDTKGARLILESGKLTMTMTGVEIGDATDYTAIDYTGENFEIVLQVKYLLDALAASPPGNVRLELKDPKQAAIVRPLGGSPTSSLCFIMPVRL